MTFHMQKLNEPLGRFFNEIPFRNSVLTKMKALSSFRKQDVFAEEGLLYFLWYAKMIDGGLFRRAFESRYTEKDQCDPRVDLAHALFLIEKNDVYIVQNDDGIRMIYRSKKPDDIYQEVRDYLRDRWRFMLRGDRYNCNTYLSESLPVLFDEDYYTYVSVKIHAKSKPAGGGDGICIDLETQAVEEVEVKYTASGGARQTFSPKQLDKKFYVLSIARSALDNATRLLNADRSNLLPVDFYVCQDKFVEALAGEVSAKDARSGSGRYEMSDMISKIESASLYEQKRTLNISI